jgi:hypothetical protein
MNLNNHYDIKGKHALLGCSQFGWMNAKTEEDMLKYLASKYSTTIGTLMHAEAADHITYGVRLNKNDKKHIQFQLLRQGIPAKIIRYIDFDAMYDNLMDYVNDCIGFKMIPEKELKYSDKLFGTCDALVYNEKDHFLRIHDLKTGVTPAHMEQLMGYAALFFLDNRIYKVKDSQVELRIYQNNDVDIYNPEPDELLEFMDNFKRKNEFVEFIME